MNTEYIWFKGGKPTKHTEDELGERPTKVFKRGGVLILYDYHANGNVYWESYYKNGIRHRDGDKPAYTGYYLDGSVQVQYDYKNGHYIP